MILSSADILRILGGSEIIRLSARIKITDQKPTLSGDDQLLIYISRFPSVAEFEATWTLWLEGDGETALVAAEIKRLLPKVQIQSGLITTLTTTDFRSEHTQTAPEAAKPQEVQIDTSAFEERFQSLQEDIEDRMLLVSSGRNGKDGKDGAAGRDGRDGRDIDATQTELFDLKDVEQSRIALKPGQVLTWDGEKWTNLYVRQSTTYVGGGGSGSGGGGGNGQINSDTITSDAPPTERENGKGALRDGDTWWKSDTGAFFVWYADGDSGQWVEVEGGEGGGGGGIPEAPIDGQQYARQDAGWSVVAPAYDDTALEARVAINEEDIVQLQADLDNINTFSGDYNDLTNKPDIPSKTSDLVNDSGFITASDVPSDLVTSVAGRTGDVTLVKDDITDFDDTDYATADQGLLADSALQPGDNITDLTNNAGFITSAAVPVTSVAGKTGDVLLNAKDSTVQDLGNYYAATEVEGALQEVAVELASLQGVNFFGMTRVATTTSITLSGLQVIDGETLLDGDRVLVKDQDNSVDNGIYTASSGAWTRSEDADEESDFIVNKTAYVQEGADNGGKTFALATVPAVTFLVGGIEWQVKSEVSTSIPNGSIGTPQLADGAVTAAKLDPSLQADEAPMDGNYYVRQNGAWVNLQTALDAMGLVVDGGTAS